MRTGRPWRARARRYRDGEAKRNAEQVLPLRHALALGLLHGPSELLPVSSSGHTTLVPWLAGWRYSELDPQLRKSFEVALHAGTAAALLLRPPASGPSGGPAFLVSAVMPPAFGGYTLGGPIEQRLGTPATIAAGLLGGSIALLAAEVYARDTSSRSNRLGGARAGTISAQSTRFRPVAQASAGDGLALGLAQALALMPGVSRSGAALVAARTRGFSREDSDRVSWAAGLPVIAGAAMLQGARLARAGAPAELGRALAMGASAAFLSTLLSARLLGPHRRAALLPVCCLYRGALALVVIQRLRDTTTEPLHSSKKMKASHTHTTIEGILRRSKRKS